MGGIGILLAAALAYADRKLYVFEDPRIDQLMEMLPLANCGACGCPGCRCSPRNCAGRARAGEMHGEHSAAVQAVANLLRWMRERRRNAWRAWPARADRTWRGNGALFGARDLPGGRAGFGGRQRVQLGLPGARGLRARLCSFDAIDNESARASGGERSPLHSLRRLRGGLSQRFVLASSGKSPAVGGVPESVERRSGGSANAMSPARAADGAPQMRRRA